MYIAKGINMDSTKPLPPGTSAGYGTSTGTTADKLGATVDDATGRARSGIDSQASKIKSGVDTAAQAAQDAVGATAATAKKAAAAVGSATDSAMEQGKGLVDSLSATVRENPLSAAASAVAIGYLIGRFSR